jgi:hypothetical protein
MSANAVNLAILGGSDPERPMPVRFLETRRKQKINCLSRTKEQYVDRETLSHDQTQLTK